MDILLEAARALGLLIFIALIAFATPLIFMIVFSLVSGFGDTSGDGAPNAPYDDQ